MTVQLLEWLIDALGLVSGWLLTSRSRAGWWFALAAQAVWLVVAVATGQWAFVAASVVYGGIAVRGLLSWGRHVGCPDLTIQEGQT
ncbi:MAG TPA: nicotinamide mononucleotide transporter [Pseudonocardiaceae bacterium]|jgi:hypothetical protein|nr:nicotinamide mononucleotide transporter [Pseudonocardiaceae bacterium]